MADGPAGFTPDFSCPALLRVPASCMPSARTGLSPSSAGRSKPFRYWHARSCGPYNPAGALTPAVWAPPRSLATTWGITIVFSSYGYLDVSVPHVRLSYDIPFTWWVAPFGYLRIKSYWPIPVAFRSLSRPSSPPRAKASTVCPCLLSLSVHIYALRHVSD